MRGCDYIADRLYSHGVRRVYGLMGGGAAGLNDGFIKHNGIDYICFHHEQGSAFAAVGESKVTNNIAVVNPTTGCGGTNCITSLLDAWQDSLPVLFISGNVKLNQTSSYINKVKNVSIRKYGIQEHDIISTVRSLTKYSTVIDDISNLPYELDKAIDIALAPRRGPVWLDIPNDIQLGTLPDQYKIYTPDIKHHSKRQIRYLYNLLERYNRPLILAGYGIHLSNSKNEFKRFIEHIQVPVVTTYLGIDLIEYNHPLNIGTIGIKGSRSGNFAIQNCDILIIMGCSLNGTHIGYDESLFSPNSYKVMIDIDPNEYLKENVKINEYIKADLKEFLS